MDDQLSLGGGYSCAPTCVAVHLGTNDFFADAL